MNSSPFGTRPIGSNSRYVLIGLEFALIPVAYVLSWLSDVPLDGTVHLSLSQLLLGAAAALVPLGGVAAVIAFPRGPFASLVRLVDRLLVPFFRDWTPWEMLLVSLAAGVGEELLFRGVVQAALTRWTTAGTGLALAGIAFGLVHFLSATYFVLASFMGWYLGWLWDWSGNLLVPMTTHAVYDFVVLLYVRRRGRHVPDDSLPTA